jgi:hypothetical protein
VYNGILLEAYRIVMGEESFTEPVNREVGILRAALQGFYDRRRSLFGDRHYIPEGESALIQELYTTDMRRVYHSTARIIQSVDMSVFRGAPLTHLQCINRLINEMREFETAVNYVFLSDTFRMSEEAPVFARYRYGGHPVYFAHLHQGWANIIWHVQEFLDTYTIVLNELYNLR